MGESGGLLITRRNEKSSTRDNVIFYKCGPNNMERDESGGNATLAEQYGGQSVDPRVSERRPAQPQVSRKQRQFILYLFRNPEDNHKPTIYLELNWPSLTVTRIGQSLIRKGLVRKVAGDPPHLRAHQEVHGHSGPIQGEGILMSGHPPKKVPSHTPPKNGAHPPEGAKPGVGTPPRRCQRNDTLLVLEHLRAARPPSELYKSGRVPRRTVMRALSELKSVGLVKKVGYGTYEINEPINGEKRRCQNVHRVAGTHTPQKVPKKVPTLKPDTARAHGIMAVMKVPIKNFTSRLDHGEKFVSWSIKFKSPGVLDEDVGLPVILKARKIPYEPRPQGVKIEVLDVEKVWLTSKSVVFYLPYSWYGENAEDCATKAMEDTIRLIRRLERMLGIPEKFKSHGSYWIKFSRQHDALIKNAIAKLYGKPGRPFTCRDERGQWLLIDNSLNLHEMETTRGEKEYQPIKPDKPLETQIRKNDDGAREHFMAMQKFLNSQKDNPEVTADYVKEMFAQTATQIQAVNGHMGYYSKHLNTHVQSVRNLDSSVNNLSLQAQENAKTTATLREAVQRLAATMKMVDMPAATKERLLQRAEKQASEPVKTLKNCALCGHRARISGLYCPECAELVKDWKKPGRMSSLGKFADGGLT